jgi:hypothetical protein
MRFWLWTAPLAMILVGGALRAQDGMTAPVVPAGPALPVEAVPPPGPMVPVPDGPPAITADGKYFPYGPVEIQASLPPRPRQPIRQALRYLNIGCYTTIHSPGCGSLEAETTFIFGSCHAFHYQPCEGRPLHVPWGPGGNDGKGCGCGP